MVLAYATPGVNGQRLAAQIVAAPQTPGHRTENR
jgi:hypothetical protein